MDNYLSGSLRHESCLQETVETVLCSHIQFFPNVPMYSEDAEWSDAERNPNRSRPRRLLSGAIADLPRDHVPTRLSEKSGQDAFMTTQISVTLAHALASFHPEMALFRNLGVNLRDRLCDVPPVRLRAIP